MSPLRAAIAAVCIVLATTAAVVGMVFMLGGMGP